MDITDKQKTKNKTKQNKKSAHTKMCLTSSIDKKEQQQQKQNPKKTKKQKNIYIVRQRCQ